MNVVARVYAIMCAIATLKLKQKSMLRISAASPLNFPRGRSKPSTAVNIHAVANDEIITMSMYRFYCLKTTLSISKVCPAEYVPDSYVTVRMAYEAPEIVLDG